MMNYDYERELKRIEEGFKKVMILIGENDSSGSTRDTEGHSGGD
jgi:hypothetical protein